MQPPSIASINTIPEERVQVDCGPEQHEYDSQEHNLPQQENHLHLLQLQLQHHIIHLDTPSEPPLPSPLNQRGGPLGQLHSPFMSKSSNSHQNSSDFSDHDDHSDLGGPSKHKHSKHKGQHQDRISTTINHFSSSDQHHHDFKQHHSIQPETVERTRHSNGYSHATAQAEHRKSTRRLSSSIHSNANTNGSLASSSSTSASIPSSPSQYSLPFNHNSSGHGHRADKESQQQATSSSTHTSGNGNGNMTPAGGAFLAAPARSRTRSKSHPDLPNIPLRSACRSSSFGCSFSMFAVFIISFTVLGCVFHSNFYHQVDTDSCDPIYMQPKYFKLLGFDRERTAFAGKYGLFLYRDQYDYRLPIDPSLLMDRGNYVWTVDKAAKIEPLGVPALFIPGNAGSAKQVRAFAKSASKYYYETLPDDQRNGKPLSRPIDFFTVDFNEEFSALHGHSLLEQAQFLNDAIAYILSLYRDGRRSDPELPLPTSVMIIGHSMGGIVARALFTMDNFKPGSVNTILTAATPHMVPPVTLDFEISNIYDKIEEFWTKGFYGPEAPLQNVSLISVAGGNRDIIVNGDSGNIHNFVPQSHGFTVFTATIPHAWVGSDHLSILWCNQIAMVVGKALLDVVDATIPEQVKPLEERMKEEIYVLSTIGHTFVEKGGRVALPTKNNGGARRDADAPHLYIMELPWESRRDTFTLLTDHILGSENRIDLMLCNDMSTAERAVSSTPSRLACQYDTLSAVPIPASVPRATVPIRFGEHTPVKEFQFISRSVRDLSTAQFIVVLDRGQKMGNLGFVVAEFASKAYSTVTAETTSLGLLNDGYRVHAFPERPSLVSTLRLPNVDNSLLTYKLVVDRQGCEGSLAPQRFSPMLRQSSWNMYEDKYATNIVSQEFGVNINFHGDVPYYDRVQLPGKKGIELTFWMDPTCPVPLTVNLQVDRYGSLGKVVIRYRMVLLVFPFLVVVLTLRAQFEAWNEGEPFKPFGLMLTELIGSTFWKFSLLLGAIAFIQSLQTRTVYSFMDTAMLAQVARSQSTYSSSGSNAEEQILRGPGGVRELSVDPYQTMIQTRIAHSESWVGSLRLENVLLGANDTFFWFLAPIFFQLSIGIVILIWILLNGLVRVVAGLLTFVSKKGGRFMIGKAIGNMLSKRSRGVRRRIITTIVLFIMVATFVPYQFAFVVAVLVHIVSCVRSLLVAQATWYEPFSSDHRLDYIAPFIFFVEAITDGAMVPRTPEKGYAAVTAGLLNFIIVFLILFGVRYSWQVFFMSRIWIMWLLVLQLKDTDLVQRLIKSIENCSRRYFRPSKKRK
ncbi:GPI inositol deacylase [Podila humilis]|nr:GPI inositol deacylase [Podila humilis]